CGRAGRAGACGPGIAGDFRLGIAGDHAPCGALRGGRRDWVPHHYPADGRGARAAERLRPGAMRAAWLDDRCDERRETMIETLVDRISALPDQLGQACKHIFYVDLVAGHAIPPP